MGYRLFEKSRIAVTQLYPLKAAGYAATVPTGLALCR